MNGHVDIVRILLQADWVVKAVISLLTLASLFSWAIIFKKRSYYKKIRQANQEFLNKYQGAKNLIDVLESKGPDLSSFYQMFNLSYSEFLKIYKNMEKRPNEKIQEYFSHFGMGALERCLRKGMNLANDRLESLLSTLASIGSISPFIGLFGTVWGIINSFSGLAAGGGTIESVAPGIAEALVVTAVGLATAIPAVWFYNHFNNENRKFNVDMDSFGQDFLNLIERSLIQEK